MNEDMTHTQDDGNTFTGAVHADVTYTHDGGNTFTGTVHADVTYTHVVGICSQGSGQLGERKASLSKVPKSRRAFLSRSGLAVVRHLPCLSGLV